MRTLALVKPRPVGACGEGSRGTYGKQHSGSHRQAGADPEQTAIDCDLERANRESRGEPRDDRDEGLREQYAKHRPGAAQHQAFGEQRPTQRRMTRAERGTHGKLTFSTYRARENEVGDIRAGDHEHDRGRRKQNEQNRARRRSDLLAQRRRRQLHVRLARIGFWMLARHRCVGRGQLRARALHRRARRETPKELRHAVRSLCRHRRAEVMRAGDHVRDDLGVCRIRHRRFEYTDDGGAARCQAG